MALQGCLSSYPPESAMIGGQLRKAELLRDSKRGEGWGTIVLSKPSPPPTTTIAIISVCKTTLATSN
ncbi:hypothetical protein RRF57_003601 [Xylaria bambusicola]|uniref:Uncharacterized protein n=1 Tax=Xylaria bambusicola TaxID=326684 RepID=A0AAN7UKG7_9PEZI